MPPRIGTIRLGEFCEIFGENPKSVRTALQQDRAPFDPEPESGGQRTYSGTDVFAWEIMAQLKGRGTGASVAAEMVREAGGYLHEFLNRLQRGEDLRGTMMIFWHEAETNELEGWREIPGFMLGSPSDASRLLEQGADNYGRVTRRDNTPADLARGDRISRGVVSLQVVPLLPAYDAAKARARAASYALDAFHVFKLMDIDR